MKLEEKELAQVTETLKSLPAEHRASVAKLFGGASYVTESGEAVQVDVVVPDLPQPASSTPAPLAVDVDAIAAKAAEVAAAKAVAKLETKAKNAAVPPPVITFPAARKSRVFRSNEDAMHSALWLASLLGNAEAGERLKSLTGWGAKTHTTVNNVSLGNLVFPAFESAVIDLRDQYGVFRREANFKQMPSDTHSVPRRVSGLTAYFVGENTSITESPDKVVDLITLTARKLAVLTFISSELNEDAVINVIDDVANEIAWSFAQREDDCGFNGDGSSTYGGIVGARPALRNLDTTVANIAGLQVASGSTYASITLSDFHNLMGRLPEYALRAPGGPKWYVSRAFATSVMHRLATAAGGNTVRDIGGGAVQEVFLGYPIVTSEVLPKVGTSGQVCALFGSLSTAAIFGERRGFSLAVSTDAEGAFAKDLLAVRGTERFDIVVHDIGNASSDAALRQAGSIVGLILA